MISTNSLIWEGVFVAVRGLGYYPPKASISHHALGGQCFPEWPRIVMPQDAFLPFEREKMPLQWRSGKQA